MPVEGKSLAILIRLRPYSETSLIIHWLTEDAGLIATMAKGARRAKSSFRGKLDLLFEAQISYQKSRAGTLHLLKEVVTVGSCGTVRNSVGALSLASYAIQLLELNLETETEVSWAFHLFRGLISSLEEDTNFPLELVAFEWKFFGAMGIAPAVADLAISPAARNLLTHLEKTSLPANSRLEAAPHHIRELGIQLFRLADSSGLRLPKSRAKLMDSRS